MKTLYKVLFILTVTLFGSSAFGQCSYTLDSLITVDCNGALTGAIYISDSGTVSPCSSPVLAINEIMYRPGLNDGFGANPSITGEYVELIGPPGLDISCYVLADGDWTITIPAGTTIPADGLFTLGHNASPYAIANGIVYDLDVANCGCFLSAGGGSGILIFTNGGEYLALYDNAGTFIEGVIYGSPSAGNTPPNGASTFGAVINTIGAAGCVSSVTIPAPASFATAPGGVAIDESLIRSPDGSGAFTTQPGGSPNACNVAPMPTYIWSNGASTQDISGLGAGIYNLTITDSAACTIIANFTVTEPSVITTIDSIQDETCGAGNGAVFLTTSGGTPAYSYLWSTGATTQNITGLTANTYTYTITDNNGCTHIDSSTVQNGVTGNLGLILTITDIGCLGDTTGAIDLQVSTGTPAYSYLWSNGATTEDLQNLLAGTYCVTVTDALGCLEIICDSISEPFFIIPQDTFYICAGDSVQIAVNTNITTINWTPTATLNNDTIYNPFASPTSTTTYVVSGTSVTNGNLVINGDFEAGNTGFTTTYAYAGGASGAYIIDVNANLYNALHTGFDHTTGAGNFMIVDAATGSQNLWCQTVNVVPNSNYDFSVWLNNIIVPTSTAFADPTIEVLINGVVVQNTGAIPENPDVWLNYMTIWNSGANTTATLCIRATGASGGGHDFGVDDISFIGPLGSCVVMDSVIVIVDSLDVSLVATMDVLCYGDSTGSISTMVNSNLTVTYNWNTGDTTANLVNLPVGPYQLTANVGTCTDTLDVIIMGPDSALGTNLISIVDPLCNAGTDGEITVGGIGGTAGYTYLWSNAATTASVTGLGAGNHTVTVSDINGCTTVLTNNLGEPTAILVQVFEVPVGCDSTDNGAATLTPTGGTPGYTYQWDPQTGSQSTIMATGLSPSTYSVTVTDNVGCTYIVNGVFIGASVPVDSNDVPLQVTTGLLDCELNAIGAMGINTANNYSYQWSNGATSKDVSGLPSGNYSVTVSNGLGCIYVQNGEVVSPFVPDVNPWITSLGVVSTTVIAGTTVDINGGNDESGLGVSYVWSTPSTDVTFGNSNSHATTVTANNSGAYVLTITATTSDSSACVDTGSVLLNIENVYNGLPNAFTPNSDGTNDVFSPVGLSGDDIVQFRVFNRWSQEIYRGDDLENGGWDGRFMGVEQPTEVYLYLLEYQLGGKSVVIKGNVTLIR